MKEGAEAPLGPAEIALLCEVTAAVVRVEERVRAASAPVRAGWFARAHLHEAVASARLDGAFADVEDLLLFECDALDRLIQPDVQRAARILRLLRAAAARHPRQLFTPRRVLAAARLEPRDRRGSSRIPEWLEERRPEATEIAQALGRALDPRLLADLARIPALQGGLRFLTSWNASGMADLAGGAPGRALAAAWLRRTGLVRSAVFLPAIGFLGHAADYRPEKTLSWFRSFCEAGLRGTAWQLGLLQKLVRAEERLGEVRPLRSNSHLPDLANLVLGSAALTAGAAADRLGVTPTAARRLLADLARAGTVREITGRSAFRVFAATL